MYRSTVPTSPITVSWSNVPSQAVDFAAIVPVSTCEDPECIEDGGCEDCAASWWTPRTADLVHSMLEVDLDTYLDTTGLRDWDPEAGQDDKFLDLDWLLDRLPPVAAATATPQWAARFLGCYRDLMFRIEDGELPYPRCTGEEMALHLVLDAAQDRVNACGIEDAEGDEEELLHFFIERQNGLPRTPSDYDIGLLRELLFEDEDVLMLFNGSLDGIESDPEVIAAMGLVNLHPNDWFTTFPGDAPVPPLEAGFDRPHDAAETAGLETGQQPEESTETEELTAEYVFTTTQSVTNHVTDPRQLLEHAIGAYDWPLRHLLDDLGVSDRLDLDPETVPDLFVGPNPVWGHLDGEERKALCRDAVMWIGGSGTELFDIPGAPHGNNVTRAGDYALDILGHRIH